MVLIGDYMKKSYKSGPRFGPNAWSWRDKKREILKPTEEVVIENVEQTTPAPVVESAESIITVDENTESIAIESVEVTAPIVETVQKTAESQKPVVDKKKK